MPVRPMLGDLELQRVQKIEIDGDQILVQHDVPGLEGDFLQRMERGASRVRLIGVLLGSEETGEGLKQLRDAFYGAEPVTFVADIATATRVDQVVIEDMGVREMAGKPFHFEYAFTLVEFTEIEPPEEEDIPPPPPPPVTPDASLVVEVVVAGAPDYDYSKVTVRVEGEDAEGNRINEVLGDDLRENNIWTKKPYPTGDYTVTASITDPQTLSESETVSVPVEGQGTARLVLRLQDPPTSRLAQVFIVHFWFDKAFIEPCLRPILKEVADYASAHPDEKMLILGHTDLTGSDNYNDYLGDRRARSVYAYLTYGGAESAAAIEEWQRLRRNRSGAASINDTWAVREYQHMLQDLGYYIGNIDEDNGPMTRQAVEDFKIDQGITPVNATMDDATWDALIEAYLDVDPLNVAPGQFFDNCEGEILKWQGCGEYDPVVNTTEAERRNRRTEILFVNAEQLPRKMSPPVTFEMPSAGSINNDWCLDDDGATASDDYPPDRCCVVIPNRAKLTPPADPCPPNGEEDRWDRQYPPDEITVTGSITFSDGTVPSPPPEFVLIAPNGHYLTGEYTSAPNRGRPRRQRANADGTFTMTQAAPKGVYIMQVLGYVVQVKGQPVEEAKGDFVCKRIESSGELFEVIIVPIAVAEIRPGIIVGVTTASDPMPPQANVLLVRKPYTNPSRIPVLLRSMSPFSGSGLFERMDERVRFFDRAVGGNELTFDGTDNVFTDAQLTTGHVVFAQGERPSGSMNDFEIRLTLTNNGVPGLQDVDRLSVVELTLDIGLSRPNLTTPPPLMSQAGKINVGRVLQAATAGAEHERAMIVIQDIQPSDFTGDITLRAITNRVRLFLDETPAAGQTPLASPHVISIPAPMSIAPLFVEGVIASATARDTGLQLGLTGSNADGDRVLITVATLEVIRRPRVLDPALAIVRFGVWDNAYDTDGSGNATAVRNGVAEADNFIGSDFRRFHVRVQNAAETVSHINVNWRTLLADGQTNDDAPASQLLTLPRDIMGVYISRGVMLVTDNLDRNFATNSGLTTPASETGNRVAGASNHRMRRARMDGFIRVDHVPQPGVNFALRLPIFQRDPDERHRLDVRVIRYTNPDEPDFDAATDAYINAQFARANARWNQVGIQIDFRDTVNRPIPADATDGDGLYDGSLNNDEEQAALLDLIPITPDNTLTVVFTEMNGSNAYATIGRRDPVPNPSGPALLLQDRYFIFINTTLNLNFHTLAHELYHVLFNRFDDPVPHQFFTFNTSTTPAPGVTPPDVRYRRRIQNRHSPDPDADPNNNNILNWARRERTQRHNAQSGPGPAPDNTTGNTLVTDF